MSSTNMESNVVTLHAEEGKQQEGKANDGGGAAVDDQAAAPGVMGAAAARPRGKKATSVGRSVIQGGQRSFSAAEQSSWLARIRTRQKERMTPARRRQLKEHVARQVRASKASRKCSKMRTASTISSRVWQRGSASVSSAMMASRAPAPAAMAAGGGASFSFGGAAAFRQQQQIRKTATLSATVQQCGAELDQLQRSLTVDLRAGDDDEGDAFGDMLAQNSQLRADAAAGEISASELRAVLAELRAEPTDDEECAANFKIFEGYSKLVEDLRKETYGFWDECKGDFEGPARSATERELKGFDSAENMGIADGAHVWFVHDMTRRCHSNNSKLGRVLAGIKTKLDLLSRQEECPVCFEAFESRPFTTLSCCHKVCTECWDHWVQIRGGRQVCPLCRNDDFLGSVGGII